MTLPLTVRRALEVTGLYFFGAILIAGRDIITPLLMAFFLSMLLLPVHRWLMKRKVPEGLSVFLSLLLLIAVVALLVWFFSAQIGSLASDFPTIRNNVMAHIDTLSHWVETKFGVPIAKQAGLFKTQSDKLLGSAGSTLSGAAASISGMLVFIALLPIYIFLMLYYKNLLLRFAFLWFKQEEHKRVEEAIRESQSIIKSYLGGLLIQVAYITVLLGGTLMILGIKHAILIGAIFALLNLIPYVGALLGNLIGVLLTLSSSQEVGPIITVLIAIAAVQFLDNNILMPRIVGSKVKINALATIVGVVVAGAIAGVSGMFLSLPLIAICKVMFDRSDHLRQWGALLGDERPPRSPMAWPVLRRKDRKVQKALEKQNDVEPPKA